jgi:hypothetical protein
MNTRYLSAALMAAGLLIAAPGFAQTSSAQKQPTQEGGGFETPCSLPWHADASADPNCKQQTQNLTPSPLQGAQEATGRKQ